MVARRIIVGDRLGDTGVGLKIEPDHVDGLATAAGLGDLPRNAQRRQKEDLLEHERVGEETLHQQVIIVVLKRDKRDVKCLAALRPEVGRRKIEARTKAVCEQRLLDPLGMEERDIRRRDALCIVNGNNERARKGVG